MRRAAGAAVLVLLMQLAEGGSAGQGRRASARQTANCPDNGQCKNGGNVLEAAESICKCRCINHWDCPGGDCEEGYDNSNGCTVCNSPWTGSDCNQCEAGYVEEGGSCTQCREATHCSGNGKMSGPKTAANPCGCVCDDEWEGDDCSTCPPERKAVNGKCAECANDRLEDAQCTECTSQTHCSGHAKSASPTPPQRKTCDCDCSNHWMGATCDDCEENWDESMDCNSCKVGRIGAACDKVCSVDDCNGRGSGPTTNSGRTACICMSCDEEWEGDTCDQCKASAGYKPDGSGGCQKCDVTADCGGHAKSVMVRNNDCKCECDEEWNDGGSCEQCGPYAIQAGGGCKLCTSKEYCNDHARPDKTVAGEELVKSDGGRTTCECTCRNYYEDKNSECDFCDTEVYEGDCDKCNEAKKAIGSAAGGWHCEKCTLDACSSSGSQGSEVATECGTTGGTPKNAKLKCKCKDPYESSGQDLGGGWWQGPCNKCKAGMMGKPPPEGTCGACNDREEGNDFSPDCNGHMTAVEATNDRSRCVCKCDDKYTGEACDQCNTGRINYEGRGMKATECIKCTSADHCNNRADGIGLEGDMDVEVPGGVEAIGDPKGAGECVCKCRNKWSGDMCETCPTSPEPRNYLGETDGEDCNKCRNGEVYPTCGACTIERDCSGPTHASKVEKSADKTKCVCTCIHPWEGEKCDECPAPWDPASNCEKCQAGYYMEEDPVTMQKDCKECNVADHCGGNADTVTSDGETCECQSNPPAWCHGNPVMTTGPNAGYCQCDGIANGYATNWCWGWCKNGWTGRDCGHCDCNKYNCTAGHCGHCRDGRVNFPYCRECNVGRDCGGRAIEAESDEDHRYCRCICKAGWRWEWGIGCARCASGYVDWNYERRREYASAAPAAQALPVGGGTRPTGEDKAVRPGDPTFTQTVTPTMGVCNPYRCDLSNDCWDHAQRVYTDENNEHCICECFPEYDTRNFQFTYGWQGYADANNPENPVVAPRTDPYRYGKGEPKPGWAQCDTCAEGYINYDTCTQCTNQKHCSSHAISVTDNCPPRMLEDHATATLVPNPKYEYDCQRTECKCTCYGNFTGSQCETCPPEYGDADGKVGDQAESCDACAPGRIGWPYCIECTNDQHCSGNAEEVTDDGTRTGCVCTCLNQWGGARGNCADCPDLFDSSPEGKCGKCGAGKAGYPKCGQACTVALNCNNKAHSVACEGDGCTGPTGDMKCVCACYDNYEGDDCGGCGEGKNQGADPVCSECVGGYMSEFGAPPAFTCKKCTSDEFCNGNADPNNNRAVWSYVEAVAESPTGKGMKCRCDHCADGWSGTACEYCPPMYGGELELDDEEASGPPGDRCNKCSSNGEYAYHGNYPACTLCAIDQCKGRATSMSTIEEEEGTGAYTCWCNCDPDGHWDGAKCDQCRGGWSHSDASEQCDFCDPNKYEEESNCMECVAGYYQQKRPGTESQFDCIKCSLEEHCEGADSVLSDGFNCYCSCEAGNKECDKNKVDGSKQCWPKAPEYPKRRERLKASEKAKVTSAPTTAAIANLEPCGFSYVAPTLTNTITKTLPYEEEEEMGAAGDEPEEEEEPSGSAAWLVPLLGALCIGLFIAGMVIRRKKQQGDDGDLDDDEEGGGGKKNWRQSLQEKMDPQTGDEGMGGGAPPPAEEEPEVERLDV